MSIGRIGDIEYTLLAGAFLKPAVYKARFTKGGLEVLSKEHSNKPYKLRIVGMRKLSGTSADPPGTAADSTCSGMTEDAAYREAAAWAGSHPQFKQTPENAKKIIGYMDAHGMCPSQKNFDAAYEAVKSTLE